MKELFDFTVKINKEVEKTETREEDGKTITVTSKVNEDVPIRIIFKQPSRRDTEEAEIQFSVEMSNCIKKGILTKVMLVKKYSDTGGIFSEDDDKRLTAMYIDIAKLQREYVALENGTAEQKQKAEVVLEKLAATRKEMVDLESTYLNLFNNTADVIAQNNIIRWFCINLAHKQEGGGKIEPLFTGSTYEQKLENMRDLDEAEDPLYQAAFRKLATFVSYWYFSKNATKEDFKKLEKDIEEGKY
jgi:hypothetical protein